MNKQFRNKLEKGLQFENSIFFNNPLDLQENIK